MKIPTHVTLPTATSLVETTPYLLACRTLLRFAMCIFAPFASCATILEPERAQQCLVLLLAIIAAPYTVPLHARIIFCSRRWLCFVIFLTRLWRYNAIMEIPTIVTLAATTPGKKTTRYALASLFLLTFSVRKIAFLSQAPTL
jgi:hypothetical protein